MNNPEYYNYGKQKEKEVFLTLKEKFKNIQETKERYSDWDFIDKEGKILIELKSRRVNSNKFNSTILGSNKIHKGRKCSLEGYKVYYIFNFLDKILYYRLKNKDIFRESFFNYKYHSFIPNNKLKELIK